MHYQFIGVLSILHSNVFLSILSLKHFDFLIIFFIKKKSIIKNMLSPYKMTSFVKKEKEKHYNLDRNVNKKY